MKVLGALVIVGIVISFVAVPAVLADAEKETSSAASINAATNNVIESKGDVTSAVEIRPSLRLFIEPKQSQFFFGQKVEFDMVLKNQGNVTLKVKDIDENTTYCLFNGSRWGNLEPTGKDEVVLEPGEALRKKMRYGPDAPGNLEIFCSYGMSFKGVRPNAQATVNVIKKDKENKQDKDL